MMSSAGVIAWSGVIYRQEVPEGMSLLRTASGGHCWGVDLREIANIRKGGCIIRVRLFNKLMHAIEPAPDLAGIDP